MANKRLLILLAGAAVSAPAVGVAQDGAINHLRKIAAAAHGATTHTVQPGENLWRIAKDNGFSEQELMDFNRLPNSVIHPGQVLRMPDRASRPTTATPRPPAIPAPPAATPNMSTYTVQSGDVLDKIARKMGVSSDALMKANGISDPRKLQIGQVLRAPGVAAPAPRPTTPTVPTTPAVHSTPVASTTHVVRSGDTLFGIASKHGVSIAQIKAANSMSSDTISIGQNLLIPGKNSRGEIVPVVARDPDAVRPRVDDYGRYKVQKGDTFYKIARDFNTTRGELMRLNQMTNPDILIPGQELTVPGGSRVVAPAPQPTAPEPAPLQPNNNPSAPTGPGATIPGGSALAGHTSEPPAIGQGGASPVTPGAGGATPVTPGGGGNTPSNPNVNLSPLPEPLPVNSGGVQDYAGYTILPGDTLDTIARTFVTTKSELMRLNKLGAPDEVKAGDQILVPTYGINLGGPY